MHKANKNLLPKNIKILFANKHSHVHTRQTGNFQQLDVRTTKKQMCITIGVPKLWNSFETNLKRNKNTQIKKISKKL